MMRRAIAVAVLVVSLVACGSESKVSERPLTSDEASLLAEVQYRNYEISGADFTVNAAYLGSGETLTMMGFVDWKSHTGRASISAQGKQSSIVEVFWNSKIVLERIPSLSKTLSSMGVPGVEYVARKPDATNRLIDRAISVVISLASKQRENALLIQQKDGSAFLRNDVLRQKEVVVMRYGKTLRYWVDVNSSQLLRFEGDSSSGTAPIVVDLLAFGKRTIKAPNPAGVMMVDSIQEMYDAALVP